MAEFSQAMGDLGGAVSGFAYLKNACQAKYEPMPSDGSGRKLVDSSRAGKKDEIGRGGRRVGGDRRDSRSRDAGCLGVELVGRYRRGKQIAGHVSYASEPERKQDHRFARGVRRKIPKEGPEAAMNKPMHGFQALAVSCAGLVCFAISALGCAAMLAYAFGMVDSGAYQEASGDSLGALAWPIRALLAIAHSLEDLGLPAFASMIFSALTLALSCLGILLASSWIGLRADMASLKRRSLSPIDIARREAAQLERVASTSAEKRKRGRL